MTRSSSLALQLLLAALLAATAAATPPPAAATYGCYVADNSSYVPGYITSNDADGLQVALNVEYIEAELFLWSAFGRGLDAISPGLAGDEAAPPLGVQMANLDDATRALAAEFGYQEVGHIRAIKDTLRTRAFSRPLMNLTREAWNEFFQRAMGFRLEPPFDPYTNSVNFLLAAYVVPYIGLTGYVGGSASLESSTAKRLVAGLLGVESGQDAVIRDRLSQHANRRVFPYTFTVAEATDMLSRYRSTLDHSRGVNDEGVQVPACLGAERRTYHNTLVGDEYSVSYARTPAQVLSIVYNTGSAACPGGFLPRGGRGSIAENYSSPENMMAERCL